MKATGAVLRDIGREIFGRPMPPEHAEGFARVLAYANWLHAVCLSAVSIVLNLGLGLLPEFFYYRSGRWPADAGHLALTGLHGFMTVFSLAAGVVLLRMRPDSPEAAGARHGWAALVYGVVMLAAVTLFSAVELGLTGSISAYLLGIAVFAMMFHTGARLGAVVLAVAYAILVAAALWLSPSAVLWHHLFVAFDAAVVFWIGSRVVFALKAVNYLQFVTIAEQARSLAAANRELARAHQFKSDLLALAGHDLRDPLNTIGLCAQTLREDLTGAASAQSLVTVIADSVRHMDRFLANLLTDAAGDARELVLERIPTELPSFVADVVSRSHAAADAKAIALHLIVEDDALRAPPARVDPARFRQILENLVGNAIKFSPPGRQVWVELSHDPARGGHRLVVRDEGPGLGAEDWPRLFSKYQRLSARPTAGESSTGLGLFIVKNLVTLHGGRVWAESAGPGCGTRFIVTLP